MVLGDSTAVLTPGEGGPPDPTETSEGDAGAQTYQKAWPTTSPRRRRHRVKARRVRRGAGPTGVTNIGGEGDARLTEAEGVFLRKACIGEATSECRNNDGGAREPPPKA